MPLDQKGGIILTITNMENNIHYTNEELINCFVIVRDKPSELIEL
jgi:site-specific DNA-adenine methylase